VLYFGVEIDVDDPSLKKVYYNSILTKMKLMLLLAFYGGMNMFAASWHWCSEQSIAPFI